VPPPPLTVFNSLNFHSEDVDWKAVNKELSEIDWQDSSGDLSPEHMLEFFYNRCLVLPANMFPRKRKPKPPNTVKCTVTGALSQIAGGESIKDF